LPTLMETYRKIYQTWLPKSDYQRADGPEFEFYDENFDGSNPDSTMYLYIPIK
jgi:AraC family transcriptional regulator